MSKHEQCWRDLRKWLMTEAHRYREMSQGHSERQFQYAMNRVMNRMDEIESERARRPA